MHLLADVPVIQPLIDFFEAILKFFHDTIGLPWGWAIIALTIIVRACLLPLTFKQFHSMQRLAQLQPEMKKLQARFKDDKERMNQEMMKLYKEEQVNPMAGSTLGLGGAGFVRASTTVSSGDTISYSVERHMMRRVRADESSNPRCSMPTGAMNTTSHMKSRQLMLGQLSTCRTASCRRIDLADASSRITR